MLLTLVLLAQVVTPTATPQPVQKTFHMGSPLPTPYSGISGAAGKIKIRRDVDFSTVQKAVPEKAPVAVTSSDCKAKEAATKLDSIVSRFHGVEGIGGTTSRIALSTPLTQMQQIRSDASELTVPPCAGTAKEAALAYMDAALLTLQLFQIKEESQSKVSALTGKRGILDRSRRDGATARGCKLELRQARGEVAAPGGIERLCE